jgi:flagellar basal-body rod protein FlgB
VSKNIHKKIGVAMNLLEKTFGIHEQALQVKAQRLEVLAQNIANADTPNFKARDLDFKSVLKGTQGSTDAIAMTQPGHLASLDGYDTSGLKYRIPYNTSFDGNTVEMSVEQAHYGQAAGQYQATLNFLDNRIAGLRRALKGE